MRPGRIRQARGDHDELRFRPYAGRDRVRDCLFALPAAPMQMRGAGLASLRLESPVAQIRDMRPAYLFGLLDSAGRG